MNPNLPVSEQLKFLGKLLESVPDEQFDFSDDDIFDDEEIKKQPVTASEWAEFYTEQMLFHLGGQHDQKSHSVGSGSFGNLPEVRSSRSNDAVRTEA